MLFTARAKVNLTLEVTGRREDGYHTVDTVYQPISLADRLWVKRIPEGLAFSCSDSTLETADNLVCRAFRLMQGQLAFDGGLEIRLEKEIPSQAGLGGGSSDAAAVLKICNELFSLGLSREKLAALGGTLGADVPALLYDGATRGSGSGALVTPIRTSLSLPLLLVKPPAGLSTPAMYRRLDELGLVGKSTVSRSGLAEEALVCGDAGALKAQLFNAFDAALRPAEQKEGSAREDEDMAAAVSQIALVQKGLRDAGAEKVLLSGSGSASFGVFADQKARDEAFAVLKERFPVNWFICPTETVNKEKI